MANFFFRFMFCLISLTIININLRIICKWFFPQSIIIVEKEVFVVHLQGQRLKMFYVGLFYVADKKYKLFKKLES